MKNKITTTLILLFFFQFFYSQEENSKNGNIENEIFTDTLLNIQHFYSFINSGIYGYGCNVSSDLYEKINKEVKENCSSDQSRKGYTQYYFYQCTEKFNENIGDKLIGLHDREHIIICFPKGHDFNNFKSFSSADSLLIQKRINKLIKLDVNYVEFCIDNIIRDKITNSRNKAKSFCECVISELSKETNINEAVLKEILDPYKESFNIRFSSCYNSLIEIHNEYRPFDIKGNSTEILVPLVKLGNTYKVKIEIGGVIRYYVFDTGATALVINSDLEKELLVNNKIAKSDYLEDTEFKIADGSIITAKCVKLNNVIIGGYTVNNVVAYITDKGGMLCGIGFMNKFKEWNLDVKNKELLIRR